jgi:glutaredoxin
MNHTMSTEPVKVFWQPGCTSCLRTKEFLTKQGVPFESIDVHNDPQGRAQLLALGARTVPVVSQGSRYTLCQSFGDVIEFLGLTTKNELLPPSQLVTKLSTVLETAARITLQFTPEQLRENFRDRNRTARATAFHLIRVAQMGLEASRQIELKVQGFLDLPPEDWTGQDISNWALDMRKELASWWQSEADPTLSYTVPTYYGSRSMHDVLERTTYHAAQHTRQITLMLESHGVVPDGPLTAETLAGLPVPDEVWG